MSGSAIPLAFAPALPSELLLYLLSDNSWNTSVIICQSRQKFLSAVVKSIEEVDEDEERQQRKTTLTIPTLLQVTQSRNIKFIYVSNVVELRGILAAFRGEEKPLSNSKEDKKEELLVVYGLVELHRNTSSWSASGLTGCLSILVETGRRLSMRVLLTEERNPRERQAEDTWIETVPLLSQRSNADSLAENSTPTTTLRNVLGRWFRFPPSRW